MLETNVFHMKHRCFSCYVSLSLRTFKMYLAKHQPLYNYMCILKLPQNWAGMRWMLNCCPKVSHGASFPPRNKAALNGAKWDESYISPHSQDAISHQLSLGGEK